MADRFFCPELCDTQEPSLTGAEAHHLLHVMRGKVGDEVLLFDGQGHQSTATIAKCGRSEVLLTVGPVEQVSREPRIAITLGVALPKGDRQKWMVEKLTEIGVATLVPLTTEHSVADLRGKSLEKLERAVVEACKQCGRNQLMQITPPRPFGEFIASVDSGTKCIAHPVGRSLSQFGLSAATEFAAAIGPEGGFSDSEVALANEHGWQSMCLGASILRIETAAIAVAAVVTSSCSVES
ncbi:Ribosomal RNA small subunit methyltransferase E [Aeoliella mucimassa]|uniref:Ribosomal RNA small subunit methyltransferase E n=2 Tax=Aeoliella mucimassa TaxID=2527972 RepID=A0A518AHF4_9BACT|nr:Ribosomal RNA small subunit methyltransferase E [Aeoliella mucimassa]